MAGFLTTSSVMMCPHGGTVTAISSNTSVQTASGPILRSSDTFTIAGCPFNIVGVLHPCVSIQWVQPVTDSKAIDDFTLTEESIGFCIAADLAVQGTVLVSFTQSQDQGV